MSKIKILFVLLSIIIMLCAVYEIYIPNMKETEYNDIKILFPNDKDIEEIDNETSTDLLDNKSFFSKDNKIKIVYQCYKKSNMTNVEQNITKESIETIKNNLRIEGNVDYENVGDFEVYNDVNRKIIIFEKNDNTYLVCIDTNSYLVTYILYNKIIHSIK